MFYKNVLLFCLLVVLACGACAGQATWPDSLKKLVARQPVDSLRADLLCELSSRYLHIRTDSALVLAQEALFAAKKASYVLGQMTSLKLMADAYQVAGNYPQALRFYLERLKLDEANNQPEYVAVTLLSIAGLYQLQGDAINAAAYSSKALNYITKNHLANYLWYSYINLGDLYEKQNDIPLSLKYNRLALQLAQRDHDTAWLGMSLNNLGNALTKAGYIDSAQTAYESAVPYLLQSGNNSFLCETYHGLAALYLLKKDFTKAKRWAAQSVQLAEKGGFDKKYVSGAALLSSIYQQQGFVDSAFAWQSRMIAVKDSVYSQDRLVQMSNLTTQEQLRQKEISEQEARAKVDRRHQLSMALLWVVIIFALLVAVFFLYNANRHKKMNLLLETQKIELQAALAKLKETQAHLIHAEKMASLGELTAGIAHEIQNPLNFVNNFAEVLNELLAEHEELLRDSTEDAIKELALEMKLAAEKVQQHGRRADAIVKGMLQHSHKSSGKKEPTNINRLADEYLRLSYHGIRGKYKSFTVEMQTIFDNKLGNVDVVPQDIARVLLNLFNNSFYAVHEKAQTAGAAYKPAVTITTKMQDSTLVITVEDNGTGIAENVKDKIFQPFFTTKPTGEGTGLGLSLSYDIIKTHGGAITASNVATGGACFTVTLPVTSGQY